MHLSCREIEKLDKTRTNICIALLLFVQLVVVEWRENFLSENCNIFSVLSIFKYNPDVTNNEFIYRFSIISIHHTDEFKKKTTNLSYTVRSAISCQRKIILDETDFIFEVNRTQMVNQFGFIRSLTRCKRIFAELPPKWQLLASRWNCRASVSIAKSIYHPWTEREILQPVQYFTFHRVKVGLGATFVRRGITESMKILNRPDRSVRRFLGMTRFRDKVHASTSRRHSLPRIELAARTVGKTDFPSGRLNPLKRKPSRFSTNFE